MRQPNYASKNYEAEKTHLEMEFERRIISFGSGRFPEFPPLSEAALVTNDREMNLELPCSESLRGDLTRPRGLEHDEASDR